MNKVKNEAWKTYPEFPSVEVSTFGEIRTLDRVVPSGKGTRLVKGQILKQHPVNGGYLRVRFGINGKRINRYVHQLVAQTFIPNPDNLPQVNHKDCNRTNNHVDNLEWCDASYNQKYREKYGKSLSHPVLAINLNTSEVSRFESQHEASRELGVSVGNVNSVIKGKLNQTKGYWFTNADESTVEVAKNDI